MAKLTRGEAVDVLGSERDYQDSLWPQDVPNNLSIGDFILLLEEYAAKARAVWATTKEPEGAHKIMDVVRKCGGICLNAIEQHGAPRRKGF